MQNSTPLAWLIGNEGTPDEIRYELVKSESTLGRGSDCEVQVDDKLASRKHAVIYYRGGNFEIEDLGSSNGTFINNKLITSGLIYNGDLIQVGDTVLQFRIELDPDATILQMRVPQETIAAVRKTLPQEYDFVHCSACGQKNPAKDKLCSKCNAVLPQLPENFQITLKYFNMAQADFISGQLAEEDYHKALAELVVQDQSGEYWMLGVESGEWYWYNGEEWNLRSAPLIQPEEEKAAQPATPAAQKPDQLQGSLPPATGRGRWGVIGLWLIGALFILAFGVYAVIEIISFSRGQAISQLDQLPPAVAGESLDSIDPAAGQSDQTTATATPSSSDSGTETGYQVRPYDPAIDGSLLRLSSETEFEQDESSEGHAVYLGFFPIDTPGLLVMGWCAIDEQTLENNMAYIRMEGTIDSITIPPEMWTVENSQEEGMYCQYFRAVVEDLESGTHKFLWSTSYDIPIFDGWETSQPGTYLKEYIVEIEYQFVDEFVSSAGHWGETERDEVKVWIEGGALHIELYQSSIGAMSNFREREFDDFMVIAHARSVSETPGSYGIVFRQQDDQTYYIFEVTDEGSFRLGKNIGETIDLIPWTQSESILKDGGDNRLSVSMEGDWIIALINGELVADLHDTSIKGGKLSLVATAPEEVDYFQVAFQKVSIFAPE